MRIPVIQARLGSGGGCLAVMSFQPMLAANFHEHFWIDADGKCRRRKPRRQTHITFLREGLAVTNAYGVQEDR